MSRILSFPLQCTKCHKLPFISKLNSKFCTYFIQLANSLWFNFLYKRSDVFSEKTADSFFFCTIHSYGQHSTAADRGETAKKGTKEVTNSETGFKIGFMDHSKAGIRRRVARPVT
jgi:hypothetical protein